MIYTETHNEKLIEEKEKEIMEIEKEVSCMNEIFRDLAFLVQRQEDGIDIISNNIERTRECTELSNVELEETSLYKNKNRKCMCCLLGTITGIAIGGPIGFLIQGKALAIASSVTISCVGSLMLYEC